MIAAYRAKYPFVDLLLRAGCDFNFQEKEGGTYIDERTYQLGSKEREERWKQRYVPVGGYTAPTHIVIVGDVWYDVDVLKLLLEDGCDAKLKNNERQTALDPARQFGEHELVEVLEEHAQWERRVLRES